MRGRLYAIFAALTGVVALAACGQSPSSLAGPVTRSHDGTKVTVKWARDPVQLRPQKAILSISPSSVSIMPETGLLNMQGMHMPPLDVHWHRVKPGEYQGSAIPTMGGSWVMQVTFHQGRHTWQESFPVEVRN